MDTLITQHAHIRMQQRSISFDMLETLLEFGQIRFNGRGAQIVTFPKRVRIKLKILLPKKEYVDLERHLNLYAVIAHNGLLVTTGYRTKKLKLH